MLYITWLVWGAPNLRVALKRKGSKARPLTCKTVGPGNAICQNGRNITTFGALVKYLSGTLDLAFGPWPIVIIIIKRNFFWWLQSNLMLRSSKLVLSKWINTLQWPFFPWHFKIHLDTFSPWISNTLCSSLDYHGDPNTGQYWTHPKIRLFMSGIQTFWLYKTRYEVILSNYNSS